MSHDKKDFYKTKQSTVNRINGQEYRTSRLRNVFKRQSYIQNYIKCNADFGLLVVYLECPHLH